jgi:hypothetical protein
MAQRVLDAAAQAVLEQYPPFMRDDKHVRALCAAQTPEFANIQAALDTTYSDAVPLLTNTPGIWEAILQLVPGTGSSIAQRRATILTTLGAIVAGGSGALWEINMAKIFGGSGWYYREFIPTNERPRNEFLNPSVEASAVGVAPANWAAAVGTNTLLTDNGIAAKYGAKVAKATYGNSTTLGKASTGSIAIAAGKIASLAAEVWVPTNWDGGQIQLSPSDLSAGTSLETHYADMALRDQWQRIWVHRLMDGSSAAVRTAGVVAASAPTAGRFIYIDGAQLRIDKGVTTLDQYGDGSLPDSGNAYEWLGAAHASASRKLSTAAIYTVDVFIPLDPLSPQAAIAEQVAALITPANLVLNVNYTGGFILGASTLGDVL